MSLGSAQSSGDGSPESPFQTLEQAEKRLSTLCYTKNPDLVPYRDLVNRLRWHIVVKCDAGRSGARENGEGCEIEVCHADGCKVQLCRAHGDGRGTWDPTKDVEQIWFPKRFCDAEGCKIAFCDKHKDQMLR